MSKKVEHQRKQPEFFFVFRNDPNEANHPTHVENDRNVSISLSEDVVKTHREKLLAELRQFGC
jgi:hypothetical protein